MQRAKRRIGLLGGSFNPAHEGHVHISLEALKRGRLDEIWWLASPQNPLKSSKGMAAYPERLATARRLAAPHKRIRVSDAEARLGTRYTIDTLQALTARNPGVCFVWVMGADNLVQFHRWREWNKIMKNIPIMVIDRQPHSHRALRSRAALHYNRHRRSPAALCCADLPAWSYVHLRRNPVSSTGIREKQDFSSPGN